MSMNAHLLQKVMEGQHNIQVVARIRPLTEAEAVEGGKEGGKPVAVEPLSSTECGFYDPKAKSRGGWKRCDERSERLSSQQF